MITNGGRLKVPCFRVLQIGAECWNASMHVLAVRFVPGVEVEGWMQGLRVDSQTCYNGLRQGRVSGTGPQSGVLVACELGLNAVTHTHTL